MAEVSIEQIKRLRELTGVGITDAKAALVDASGDFDKALAAMRKKGLTKAEARSEREARSGLIGSYVHEGRIGVLVEVNCETDFVAKTDEFKSLVNDICLHIAASAPEYVSAEEVPAAARKTVQAEFTEKAKSDGKPADMVNQIVEGQLSKYFEQKALLGQPFVKDPGITVGEYVKQSMAKLGENIVIRRFRRFVLGEVN